MNTPTTPVERAAGLYETALQNARGKECNEKRFFVTSHEDAMKAVTELLTLEGMEPEQAAALARAGKLHMEAKRRGRI